MYVIHLECPPFGFYFGFADLNFIIPKGAFIFKNYMFNIFWTPRLTRGILYTKKHPMMRGVYSIRLGSSHAKLFFAFGHARSYLSSLAFLVPTRHYQCLALRATRPNLDGNPLSPLSKSTIYTNKYPRVKTRGISYAGKALCYQPPSTRVLRSATCILLLERAIWIIYP